jgi:N-acetylglucosaminyl-diphospho-decaprenol L-rhamnosyltransferase
MIKASQNHIGVVVVTHQSASTIVICLEKLRQAMGVERIVIVDNDSHDATIELVESLAEKDKRITLVKNKTNIGFAAACNQGASAISEAWLVFLNPDVYLKPDSLLRLRDSAIIHAGAGLLGVELIDEKGVLDPAARRFDFSLLEFFKRRGNKELLYMGRDPTQPVQKVEACSGALMMLPSTVFHLIAGFDSGYRLHVEDLDLARRVRQAGYDVMVDNRIQLVHIKGTSSRARPVWVEWQKHCSIWRYFKKYEASSIADWLVFVLWVCVWLHFLYAAPRNLILSYGR